MYYKNVFRECDIIRLPCCPSDNIFCGNGGKDNKTALVKEGDPGHCYLMEGQGQDKLYSHLGGSSCSRHCTSHKLYSVFKQMTRQTLDIPHYRLNRDTGTYPKKTLRDFCRPTYCGSNVFLTYSETEDVLDHLGFVPSLKKKKERIIIIQLGCRYLVLF